MRLMTLNVRYDNASDGENGWNERRGAMVEMILEARPCLFGLQEALMPQVRFIAEALERKGRPYAWYAVGRDDGVERGETTAIFYRTEDLFCMESGTFWLSDQPDVPGSRFPSAALPRIVSWVKLQDNHFCCKPFFVFNTHFDHRGVEARELSAHLVLQKISAIAGLFPAVLMGDFNDGEHSNTYRILTGSYLTDGRRVAPHKVNDHLKTFTGFYPASSVNIVGNNIDYLFVSGFFVSEFEVVDRRRPCGLAISDHRALIASCSINV